MVRRTAMFAQWMVIAGLVSVVALGGCAKRNVLATTSGAESREAPAKPKVDGVGGGGILEAPRDTRENLAGEPAADNFPVAKTDLGQTGMKTEPLPKSDGSGKAAPSEPAGSGRTTESLGPIGTGPLQGFSKGSSEERLGDTPPMMIAKAEPQVIETRRTRDEKRRELADIYFAFDKWLLSNEGKKNLAESAEFLKQNPTAKLVIEGYCDERGSREYNLVLGEKRAKETRRYLADLGIQNAVSVTSYGKERQVCTNRDESCYWRNRRAHLLIDAGK